LLDCRPGFLPKARRGSLLLAPLGEGTVLSHLRARLAPVTGAPPVIATRFEFDPEYERALREVCPDAEAVVTLPAFAERVYSYEPSDRLLIADPTCFPFDPSEPAVRRLTESEDTRSVKHLVAIDRREEGTREFVDADASGRIRSIQRYYDSVTWQFAAGIAASLVPVAYLRVAIELPISDLRRLRRVLSAEGVPTRDIPLERGVVNLAIEQGLLAINEAAVLSIMQRGPERNGRRASLYLGAGARLDSSASVVGPVVLQEGAEVAGGVTLIGPAVIGRGSRVASGATIAQSVVGPGQDVPAGTTLRHCVFLGAPDESAAERVPGDGPALDGNGGDAWDTPPHVLSAERLRRSFYPALKRAIDATLAGLGLLLLSPLCLLIAVLIKLESKGPAHFGHIREGLGGRPFQCWKFRTMIPGADQQQRKLSKMNQVDGPQFKVTRDPRRTRMGRFLSATNLDEIPQLWNVLVGEMSLVGPRPSPFRENQVCVPWREGRLSVRPGITGLWQVCRHDRDKGDFHQWIYYDLLYVRNLSFWLDLKILALTPLSFVRSGYVPLSWLLSPERYGERRSSARRNGADRVVLDDERCRSRRRVASPAEGERSLTAAGRLAPDGRAERSA
jgi:lipopolysaccharide/colanic/teichoic acid biosynthesis glycosyltransferase